MSSDRSQHPHWAAWKRTNAEKLLHPAGFEEKFVDLVLTRIPSIKPSDVIPQFAFKDDRGRNRRIDFVILNDEKGYLLPIELDGASKDDVRTQWTDFLERQNSLIGSFGTVLRYSNAKMFNNPNSIIREISEHLAIQAASRLASDQRQAVLSGFMNPSASPSNPIAPVKSGSIWKPIAIAAFFTILGAGVVAAFSINQRAVTLSGSPAKPEYITPAQAAAHFGESKLVCGLVANVSEVQAGRFINFERAYPNQTMTGVIWRRDFATVGVFDTSTGDTLCIEGVIREYDGKPSIQLTEPNQITR